MESEQTTTDPGEIDLGENPLLSEPVVPDTPVKNWLVGYVGEQHSPEDGSVTVEMIVETLAQEFPEFILAMAEENWIRGYHQAMTDVHAAQEGDTPDDDEEIEEQDETGEEFDEE